MKGGGWGRTAEARRGKRRDGRRRIEGGLGVGGLVGFGLGIVDGKFVGVNSGWGPTSNRHKEARFACNLYLQSAEEAYKVLNDIAAVFRGLLYWQEGN